MKIRAVGAEVSHAEGQTGMTKLIVVYATLRKRLQIHFSLHNERMECPLHRPGA
jgi:hypothetical protein